MADLTDGQGLPFVFFQQGGGHHNQARGAESALYRAAVRISLLYRRRLTVFHLTFGSADLLTVRPDRQIETGIHRDSVDKYRAGTALTDRAAMFDTDKPLLTQDIGQPCRR